jgi:hypothetical protein
MRKILLFTGLLSLYTCAYTQTTDSVTLFSETLNEFLNVRDFTISRDGKEAYFTAQSPGQEISKLVRMVFKKGRWTSPEILPFCDEHQYMEPFLSADGLRLYFVSDRPNNENNYNKKNFDIWYVERIHKKGKWSIPQNIGKPVNTEQDEFYPTLADNNNLYFTMDAPVGMGKDDIYCAIWNGKGYNQPALLDTTINSNGYEFNAFISGNERMLLFTKYNAPDGLGSGDLYVSQKDSNGNWLPAVSIGTPVNTPQMEYCPFYDEKNQILYFTSRRNELSPRKFIDIRDFQEYTHGSGNGLSKIYQIKFSIDNQQP